MKLSQDKDPVSVGNVIAAGAPSKKKAAGRSKKSGGR